MAFTMKRYPTHTAEQTLWTGEVLPFNLAGEPIGRKDKEGELEERTGFVLGSVFDVSQTQEIGGAQ